MKFILSTPFLTALMTITSAHVAEAHIRAQPNERQKTTKPRAVSRTHPGKRAIPPHQARARAAPRSGPDAIVGGEQSDVGEFPYYGKIYQYLASSIMDLMLIQSRTNGLFLFFTNFFKNQWI